MSILHRIASIVLAAATVPLAGCALLGAPPASPVEAAAADAAEPAGAAAGAPLALSAAPRAAAFCRVGCQEGFAQGCNNLGWLHVLGRGVERSPGRAMALFTR